MDSAIGSKIRDKIGILNPAVLMYLPGICSVFLFELKTPTCLDKINKYAKLKYKFI